MTEVRSRMVATVRHVVVGPGASVGAGDPILFVESMKMALPVNADRAGRIAAIRVSPGDEIREGDVLAILEDP
ncbi:MAG: biotin/lipoyl-binding carrier protein [Nitriliruptorales bacterium]